MSDTVVRKVFVCYNRFELVINVFEVWLEESWFNLSELVELDKSIFEDSLIFFLEGFRNNLNHKWKQWNESLCLFTLGN